jgi:plastocyanin
MEFKKLFLVFALFGLLLFGCITQEASPVQKNTTPIVTAKRPSFDILSPLEDATITITDTTTDLVVKLRPNNLALVNSGTKNKEGEGHFTITLDGNSVVTAETTYKFNNLSIGQHTLRVEVKQNDDTSYNPKIVKTITFTIAKEQLVAEPKTYEIGISNFAFSPAEITIAVNDTIVWKNTDQMPHTATSLGNFDTGAIQPGGSDSVTFTKAGVYSYICTIHPNMKGKVTVQ